jgi:hypothetical protein
MDVLLLTIACSCATVGAASATAFVVLSHRPQVPRYRRNLPTPRE